MRRTHVRRIRTKPITRVFIILLVLWLFFCFCESRVKLLPPEYISASASAFAEKQVNALMEERLSAFSGVYELQTGEDGRVNAVNTDAAALAQLKSGLADQLNKRLCGTYTAFIPFGSLLSHRLLNGVGFSIPVNLYFTGSAKVDIKSEIVSAGVNQSKYRLVARVDAQLNATSLTTPGTYSYSGEYILCETVLLGEVPIVAR